MKRKAKDSTFKRYAKNRVGPDLTVYQKNHYRCAGPTDFHSTLNILSNKLAQANLIFGSPVRKVLIMTMTLTPVGLIHSPYATKEEAPIQGTFSPEGIGQVVVFLEYMEGLKDIETFSHIILFYQFHQAGEVKLVRPTFLDDEQHGVFASRHPCRPNGLGLTIVKLINRFKNILEVSGIDVLDGTPLIDIKPYIPRFDCFPEANEGWAALKKERPKPVGRE